MKYSNYNDIERAIRAREDFQGNSASAYTDNEGVYHIISYSTEMATISPLGHVKYFNDKYYSRTTSRLQNIIKSAFDIKEK